MKETIVQTTLPTISNKVRSQSNKHNASLDVKTNTSSLDAGSQEITEIDNNVQDLASPDTKKRRTSCKTHCFRADSENNCGTCNSVVDTFLEEHIDAKHNPQETISCHQRKKENVEKRPDDFFLVGDPNNDSSNICLGNSTIVSGYTKYSQNAGEMDLPHEKRRKSYNARVTNVDVNGSCDPGNISSRKRSVSPFSETSTEVSLLYFTKIKEEAPSELPAAEEENKRISLMKKETSCASMVREADIANPYGSSEADTSLNHGEWYAPPSNCTSMYLINEHNSAKSDIVLIKDESIKIHKRKLETHEKKLKELLHSSASVAESLEEKESCSSFQILQSKDSVGQTSASCTESRQTSESSDDVKNISSKHCPPKDASAADLSKDDPNRLTGVKINDIKSSHTPTVDLSIECPMMNNSAEGHTLEDTSTTVISVEVPDSISIEKEGQEISSGKVEIGLSSSSYRDSHYAQLALLPSKVVGCPRRKLLILDVNGLLADIVPDFSDGYTPDTWISMKAVFKRPFCDDFLDFCFERFNVGIWSSRTRKNVDKVVEFLLGKTQSKLLFCWDQHHCTETGYMTIGNKKKPLVLKEIRKLWDIKEADLPWEKGDYNESNTLLLDDSPYKALCNPPYTAIFPYPYEYKDIKDKSLGHDGQLRVYLEKLALADNVQKFVKENPLGQRPITKSSLHWPFYSNIIKKCEIEAKKLTS